VSGRHTRRAPARPSRQRFPTGIQTRVAILTSMTPEGSTTPSVDELLEHVDSKYRLVLVAAKRARQINAYYSQLGEGLLENVGPLVDTAPQEKPLSIAMREINAGVLEYKQIDPAAEAAARAEAAKDPDFDFGDPLADLDALADPAPAPTEPGTDPA